MTSPWLVARGIAVAILCVGFSSRADVPPPPGYVETCTVEKQCKTGEEGLSCSASHMQPDRCEKLYAKDGYAQRCKTDGASAWTEVWCRPKGKAKAKPGKGP